jgi:mono/diheme cytochrome c family protein
MVAAGDTAAGQKVFETNNCTGCHGTPKAPGKKAPNLYKLTWDDKHIDEAFEIVMKGKKPMPAYADKVKDKDIADVVAYLKANAQK